MNQQPNNVQFQTLLQDICSKANERTTEIRNQEVPETQGVEYDPSIIFDICKRWIQINQ